MIKLIEIIKMDQEKIIINADLIETIENTPDTMIKLTTGRKFIVLETKEEIVKKVISYKRNIFTKYI